MHRPTLIKCSPRNVKIVLTPLRLTNISKSFTYKMAAKTSWYRYGTKLRHSHRMYNTVWRDR